MLLLHTSLVVLMLMLLLLSIALQGGVLKNLVTANGSTGFEGATD
jgi:hypothetical protein